MPELSQETAEHSCELELGFGQHLSFALGVLWVISRRMLQEEIGHR